MECTSFIGVSLCLGEKASEDVAAQGLDLARSSRSSHALLLYKGKMTKKKKKKKTVKSAGVEGLVSQL